ncbi:hypothetical protein GCM10023178_39040 [Actinomadura luteofluorescens]
MGRRPPGRVRATRYTRDAESAPSVPDRVPAKVLREITEASRAGKCLGVESMTTALAALKWFLRQPGRRLTAEVYPTCPCHDPREALDTLHEIAAALPPNSRRQVLAIVAPLAEQYQARTLHDPSTPEDWPWWRRRIADL